MANNQDQDLVYLKKLKGGDDSAFRYFIKTYQDMAFTIAVSIVKDDFIAEEVAQDAFLKAYKNIQLFNMQSAFKTWFYAIVVNESLLRFKKLKKDFLSFSDTYDYDVPDNSFEDFSCENDDMELINSALKLMLPNESLVLRLYYLEEGSIKDIHTITGFSVPNVKVLLHRARKNMLNILQKQKKIKLLHNGK